MFLPTSNDVATPEVSVTNCDGQVFAGASIPVSEQYDVVVHGFRQTRTTEPLRLAAPTQPGFSIYGMSLESFSADGSLLLGYAHNGIGNLPYTGVWNAAGEISEPFQQYPRMGLVLSPDGTRMSGRGDCEGGHSCGGVAVFDASVAGARGEETYFRPPGVLLAMDSKPAISHDRTTVAGSPQDAFWRATYSTIVWFRTDGETIEFPCLAQSCRPVAITSHGSVVLLDEGSVWTFTRGLRSFTDFLSDSEVELPDEVTANALVPKAISDDGRVIVGYFGRGESQRAFKLTLSPAAYR